MSDYCLECGWDHDKGGGRCPCNAKSKYAHAFVRRPDGNYEIRFSFAVVVAPEWIVNQASSDMSDFKDQIMEPAEREWENCRLDFLRQLQDIQKQYPT